MTPVVGANMKRPLIWLLTLALACPAAADEVQSADAWTDVDGEALFFAGVDLKAAGDCEGAIARLELALTRDPSLAQAELHLAECFHELGMDENALEHLTRYLGSGLPGAQIERARELVVASGGDPDAIPVVTLVEDEPERAPVAPSRRTTRPWSTARVELALAVEHFANDIRLVALGPHLEARFIAWRYLEVGGWGRVGFGRHPQPEGGTVIVPEFGASIAVGLPVAGSRLLLGILVPFAVSRLEGEASLSAGILGAVGLRFAVPGSGVFVGFDVESGYHERFRVGGGVRVGVQLGGGREVR